MQEREITIKFKTSIDINGIITSIPHQIGVADMVFDDSTAQYQHPRLFSKHCLICIEILTISLYKVSIDGYKYKDLTYHSLLEYQPQYQQQAQGF